MEFVFEFLFELIVEGIFGLTVKNSKVKTWVKTLVFLVMTEAVAVFFFLLSFAVPTETGKGGALVVRFIAIGLGIGFFVMAVDGHKRSWK